jgi:hypothetical protein
MPLPANVTTVTVLGTFLTPEGNPSTGIVTFTPSAWLNNPGANIAIPNSSVSKTLGTAGDFTVLLPVTDDTDLSPENWVYNVSEVIDGVSQNYNILLPGTAAPGGTAFLADLVPAAPAGPEYYSLASSLSIGTVTTVATGGSATATITGLAPSQVLSLGLPTGATGTVASAGSGSVGTAAVAPTGDPNTGIYFPAADQVAITTGGTQALLLAAGAVSNPTFSGTVGGVLTTNAGAVDQAMQFAAEGSILENLPARIPAAEQLLKQAVWWIDSAHSSASGQSVTNLGWGGTALNAQLGSAGTADSNDPRYLDWDGENYVYLPGVASNFLSVPDEAALDITGDIDIRVRVALDDWTPGAEGVLLTKGGTGAANFAYNVRVRTDGTIRFGWSPDGSAVTNVDSTVATGVADGSVKWVRVTFDADNGASGNDTAFYVSDDGVTWSQLGTTVTTAGVATIHNSNSVMRFGQATTATGLLAGKFYRAQILNGIGGPPVLDIDCSQIGSGSATSFVALTGQTVTVSRSTSGRKTVAVTHPLWLLGTDDYLEVADNDLIDFGATDSFAVLLVSRMPSYTATQTTIAKRAGTSTAQVGWNLRTGTGTPAQVAYQISDGTAAASAASASLAAGALSVAAMIRDVGTDAVIGYSQGIAASVTDTTTGTLANSEVLRVGRSSGAATAYADMEFIAAAVFRRALTATEVTTLTNYYSARIGA